MFCLFCVNFVSARWVRFFRSKKFQLAWLLCQLCTKNPRTIQVAQHKSDFPVFPNLPKQCFSLISWSHFFACKLSWGTPLWQLVFTPKQTSPWCPSLLTVHRFLTVIQNNPRSSSVLLIYLISIIDSLCGSNRVWGAAIVIGKQDMQSFIATMQ